MRSSGIGLALGRPGSNAAAGGRIVSPIMPNGTPEPSPRPDPGHVRAVRLPDRACAGRSRAWPWPGSRSRPPSRSSSGRGSLAGDAGLVAAASPMASPRPRPPAAPSASAPAAHGSRRGPRRHDPGPASRPRAAAAAAPSAPSPQPTRTPEPTPDPDPDGDGVPDRQLQAHLDRLRAKLDIPGVSVAILWDDGRTWTGASGLRDVSRARADDHRHGLRAGVGVQDVHRRRRAPAGRRGQARRSTSVSRRCSRTTRCIRGSPSASCSTTRAACPTTSSTAEIDRPLQSAPDAAWTAARRLGVRAAAPQALPRRAGSGTTRTPTTCCSASSSKAVTGRPLDEEIRGPAARPAGARDGVVPGRRGAARRGDAGLPAGGPAGGRRPDRARWPRGATSCRSARS